MMKREIPYLQKSVCPCAKCRSLGTFGTRTVTSSIVHHLITSLEVVTLDTALIRQLVDREALPLAVPE